MWGKDRTRQKKIREGNGGNDYRDKERNDGEGNKINVGEEKDNDGQSEKWDKEVENNGGICRKEWDGKDATDLGKIDG